MPCLGDQGAASGSISGPRMNADAQLIPSATDGSESSDRALRALVLWCGGIVTCRQAALMAGLSEGDLLVLAEDPTWQTLVEVETARLREKLVEAKALNGLDRVVQRAAEILDGPALSAGALSTIGEFLRKTSGVEQRRAAELRATGVDAATPFGVAILHAGDPEPNAGFRGVVVRLGSRADHNISKEDGDVVDSQQ
jgi:hypothetical protein